MAIDVIIIVSVTIVLGVVGEVIFCWCSGEVGVSFLVVGGSIGVVDDANWMMLWLLLISFIVALMFIQQLKLIAIT